MSHSLLHICTNKHALQAPANDHVQVPVHVLAKPFLALHLHQMNWDKTPDAPERTQPLVVLHGGPQVPSDYLFDLAKVRPKP
jgi:hypothetical protein